MSSSPKSMTGFGRAESEFEGSKLSVEARSVNSRHRDIRVRLPNDLRGFEPALKELAAGHFERGQIELSVRFISEGVTRGEVEVDLEAARRYSEAASAMADLLPEGAPLSASALLPLPGVARLREPELDADALGVALSQVANAAIQAAVEMREREGASLDGELRGRLDRIEAAVSEVELRSDEVRAGLRERLVKRLSTLAPELELDPARLEQEVVIFADRMDVTEETVRLRSHLDQFRETLGIADPIGRKLEFLLQEMGREVNTIGSKASDVPITRSVVDLKTELEKIREQVLNIE